MNWIDELMWASASNAQTVSNQYIVNAMNEWCRVNRHRHEELRKEQCMKELNGYWNKKETKMNDKKSIDPWAHRSSGMKCKSCMWFAPKKQEDKPEINLGRCRRHAPTMNGYPVVFVNDWCGDHKLNENWK